MASPATADASETALLKLSVLYLSCLLAQGLSHVRNAIAAPQLEILERGLGVPSVLAEPDVHDLRSSVKESHD